MKPTPTGIAVRRATEADAPLVADLVALADRSGGAVLSYAALFDLSEGEAQALLRQLAELDELGQELCWPNFYLIERGGVAAGGLAAWVEGAQGLSSAAMRGQLLAYALGTERFLAARARLQLLEQIDLPRTPHALQLDSIALLPTHQGQGLLRPLVAEAVADQLRHYPSVHTAEIHLLDSNARALHAYAQLGFTEVGRSHSADPAVSALVSGTGRVALKKLIAV